MKKVVTFIIAIAMCLSSLFTVVAFADTTEEYDYYFSEDFSTLTTADIPLSYSAAANMGGLVLYAGYATASTIADGALNLSSDSTATNNRMIDFVYDRPSFGSEMTGDFTVSLSVKPTGTATWNDSTKDFFIFRKENISGLAWNQYFYTSNGSIGMVTDSGNVTSKVLPKDSYTTVEWMFKKTGDLYSSVELWIDGVQLGVKTLNDSSLTTVKHIRLFQAKANDYGMSIDSYVLFKGAKSHHGVELPENSMTPPAPPVSAAPTVTDDQKTERKYFFHNDFSTPIYAAEGPKNADLIANKGFWLNDSGDTSTWSQTDGVLNISGAQFLDLQLYTVRTYNVKEDFVLSFKFMAKEEGLTTDYFLELKRDATASNTLNNAIRLQGNHVWVDDTDCGSLPVNEWVQFDIAFNYNDENFEFDSFTLMLNGYEAATKKLSGDLVLTKIGFFRMFRYLSRDYAIDDLFITSGDQSILYALPYVAPETDTENNVTDQTDNTQETTEPTNEETASTGEVEVSDTTDTQAVQEERKGCGSTVSGISIAMLSVAAAGICIRKKKKQ